MRGRGVYRGRGRGRGYARGSSRGRGGGGRTPYHTGYPNNKHINKKWVRETPNDDDENGLKGSTSSAGYPIKSNISVSNSTTDGNSKSTSSSYKWKRQSPATNTSESNFTSGHSNEAASNIGTIGEEKTTVKVDSNDMKQSASVSTQSKSSNTHVSLVNQSNTWKRQSSEIDDDSSNRKHAVFAQKGDNSWKRQKTISEKKITPRKDERSPAVHNRKRKHTGTSGPRRINLSISKEEGGALDSEDEDKNDITLQKTLTDFCYQDTGRGRGGRGVIRGRGRGRGRGRPTVKGNIGLVRVQDKNLSNTPICPTFRRGMPCNDPKCKLRHDVAAEASRPICVFFQRNGMCSKGDDCPFRHIKVPWNAEICPMFQKVGYCEDANCRLRHVDAKKSSS